MAETRSENTIGTVRAIQQRELVGGASSSNCVYPVTSEYGVYNIHNRNAVEFKAWVNLPEFTNTHSAYSTKAEARNSLNVIYRHRGIIISYPYNGNWVNEQFVGNDTTDWTNDSNWMPIGSGASSSVGTLSYNQTPSTGSYVPQSFSENIILSKVAKDGNNTSLNGYVGECIGGNGSIRFGDYENNLIPDNVNYAAVFGTNTQASANCQAVFGKYNAANNNALFIIGDGDSDTASNAALIWKNSGSVENWSAGDVTCGGTYNNPAYRLSDCITESDAVTIIQENIAKSTLVFDSYSAMVTDLNEAEADAYREGTIILVRTAGAKSFWITNVMETPDTYEYSTDTQLLEDTETTPVQMGYYKIIQYEVNVDLSSYVQKSQLVTINGDNIYVDSGTPADITFPTVLNTVSNSNTTNAVSGKAVADYVTNNAISTSGLRRLDTTKSTSLQTASDEQLYGNTPIELHKVSKTGKHTDLTGYVGRKEDESTANSGEKFNSAASALGQDSHAEGTNTQATGNSSHAEGSNSIASGAVSSAHGAYTIAQGACQSVFGAYNIAKTSQWNASDLLEGYAMIVGGGNSINNRKNIFELQWNGNLWASGKVFVGTLNGSIPSVTPTANNDLTTKYYVDNRNVDYGKIVNFPDENDYLCFKNVGNEDCVITLVSEGNVADVSLEYSYDKKDWFEFEKNQNFTLEENSAIYMRNTKNESAFSTSDSNYYHFNTEGSYVELSGDVTYLLSKNGNVKTVISYALYKLFYGVENIVSAPKFVMTALQFLSCAYMFNGCENISYIDLSSIQSFDNTSMASMLDGTADNGTLIVSANMNSTSFGQAEGWNILHRGVDVPEIQSDWSVGDSNSVAFVRNKPTLATVATSGSYNDLTNKPTIITPVQSDYNQTDSTALDFIKNRPVMFVTANTANFTSFSNVSKSFAEAKTFVKNGGFVFMAVNGATDNNEHVHIYGLEYDDRNASTHEIYQLHFVNLSYPVSGTILFRHIYWNNNGVSDVMTGAVTSYEPNVQSNWNATEGSARILNKPNLATVATSGSYTDLSNQPLLIVHLTQVTETTFSNADKSFTDIKNAVDSGKLVVLLVGYSGYYREYIVEGSDSNTVGFKHIDIYSVDTVKNHIVYVDSQNSWFATTQTIVVKQANWTQPDPSAPDFIKNKPTLFSGSYNDLINKPTIPTVNNAKITFLQDGVSKGSITLNQSGDATIALEGSSSSGQLTQVQANWEETDDTDPSFIANKPTLATVATSGDYEDLSNAPTLTTVATTGDYDDLTNKPSIPDVLSDLSNVDTFSSLANNDVLTYNSSSLKWNNKAFSSLVGSLNTNNTTTQAASISSSESFAGTINLHKIAKTGTYSDLIGLPTLFSGDYTDLTNKPSFATVATTGSYTDLINKPNLFSGNYNDLTNKPTLFDGDYDNLTNKPTIPAAQIQVDWDQTSNSALDYIKNKPNLATVATSGSYNDLSNKPTIPAAQVQSDWNASTGMGVILNKPDILKIQMKVLEIDSQSSQISGTTQSETWSPNDKEQTIACIAIQSGVATLNLTINASATNSNYVRVPHLLKIVNTNTSSVTVNISSWTANHILECLSKTIVVPGIGTSASGYNAKVLELSCYTYVMGNTNIISVTEYNNLTRFTA